MNMKSLMLMVKKKWFDQIKSGEKTIDYRDCTEFWAVKLCEDAVDENDEDEEIVFKKFDQVKFLCGKETLVKTFVKTEVDIEEGLFLIYFS